MGPEDCEEIDIHLIPRWDRVRQYLISRRSVRGYIKRVIEEEKILQLLDVARYAPNGANRQVIRWVVSNRSSESSPDCRDDHRVDEGCEGERTRPLYEEAKLELFVESWELGQDRISRGSAMHYHGLCPER